MNEKAYFLRSGIMELWHDKTLDDFTQDRKVLKIIKNYLRPEKLAEAKKEGVGFYLHGKNGTGKTLLLNTAFKEILKIYKVRIISFQTLVTNFANGWYDQDKRSEYVQMMQSTDFLGIDEIGKQHKQKESELAITVLDTVLRYRVQRKKPLWCTSNVTAEEMEGLYGKDIASMLAECCLPLEVAGEDMRIVVNKKNRRRFLDYE
jgi:DNA replication protein DnaC